MHKQKSHKLLWITGFLILLIITISVSYALGSQQHDKNIRTPKSTTQNKPSTVKSSNVKSSESNKTTSKSNNNNQSITIPNQFWGTWYYGSEKYAVISADKFIFSSDGLTITKNSLPLQLCDARGPRGSYEIYHNPDPNAIGAEGGDGNAYWIGNLTINGKSERVLACYVRQGVFEIFTSHPTTDSQWIQYDVADWDEQIGNPNLDFLKGKSSADLSKSDNGKHNDSDDDDKNQTDSNQKNSDSDNTSNNSTSENNKENINQ